jgi:signal transduction histidine kinase
MLSLILLSLLIVGGGSVYFNVRQYNNSQYENIIEKTQSVLVEIEHKFGDYKSLKDENPEYINYLLIKFSNVFYSDINLYDLEGNLLSSSRPEIFIKGLLGNKMNPDAYYQLKFNRKSEYIHNEKIGNLNYLSAYIPFRNYMNQEVAYLNLPYFTKQDKLKSEISKLVVAIANSYLILFLITAFLAVLLAKNVTRPLRLIQKKFHEIQLGKQNEKIKYGKKNEIGELVAEYNRMVDELMKSAELLAKSERESAWREMARQIAHEIKNPLTPMKLSVQHLQRSWQSKDANYDKLQQKVTLTLIEQIDTLSSIATEFSMFANMPKSKNEKINIITKINNTVNLYSDEESPEITIENHGSEEIFVCADKEQIIRVFNNIIKNSIQAIPVNRKGLIQIEIVKDQQNVIISIRDNGAGIEEKLIDKIFEPNFTTKSSGMGLGLAMSRNIIEQSDGKIWFETELNKGTVFYISLPLAEK